VKSIDYKYNQVFREKWCVRENISILKGRKVNIYNGQANYSKFKKMHFKSVCICYWNGYRTDLIYRFLLWVR
jgi:hypothetical protein